MLMVCGMYQLLGSKFVTLNGEIIRGLGIIDIETHGFADRIIGNITVNIQGVGEVVGYENHSGRTYLGAGVRPLGSVIRGVGNVEDSGCEGVRDGNIFATYMHGPVLSKSPAFADELILLALKKAGLGEKLAHLDDSLELKASTEAKRRPR
jgi:hypothetical protein